MGFVSKLKELLGLDDNEIRGRDLRVVDSTVVAESWRAELDSETQLVEIHIVGHGFGSNVGSINVATLSNPHNKNAVDILYWSDSSIIFQGIVDSNVKNKNKIVFHTNLEINVPTLRLATISNYIKNTPVGTRITAIPRTPPWTVTSHVASDASIVLTGTRLNKVGSVVLIDDNGQEHAGEITLTGTTSMSIAFPDTYVAPIDSIILAANRGSDVPYKQIVNGPYSSNFTLDDIGVVGNDFNQNDIYFVGTGFQVVDSVDTIVANIHGGTINLPFTVTSDTEITIQYTGPLTIVDSWTITTTTGGHAASATLTSPYYVGHNPTVTASAGGVVTITDPNSNGHSFGAKWDIAQIFLVNSNNTNPSYTSTSPEWSVVSDAIVITDPTNLEGWTIEHIQMEGINYHGNIIPNIFPPTEIDIPGPAGSPILSAITGALPNLDIVGTHLDTVTSVTAEDDESNAITFGAFGTQNATHLVVDYVGLNTIVNDVTAINPIGRATHFEHFLIGQVPTASSVTHGISITGSTDFAQLFGAVQIKLETNNAFTYSSNQFVTGTLNDASVQIVDATNLAGHTIVEVKFYCIIHQKLVYDMTGLSIVVA